MSDRRFVLILPTLNAAPYEKRMVEAIRIQTCKPSRVIVVDSSSSDGSDEFFRTCGFEVSAIDRASFDHGGTRQAAIESLSTDEGFAMFLTQDAIPLDSSVFSKLLMAFDDTECGAAYGRQIPVLDGGPFGTHARLYNYPDRCQSRSMEHVARLGLRAAFLSNSFAAFRLSDLQSVGGFPRSVPLGEDMIVAARMLLAGRRIAYVSAARVTHSHDFTHFQEAARYFRTGKLHAEQDWLLRSFSTPEAEGMKFVLSEARFIWRHAPSRILEVASRAIVRYASYRAGRMVGSSVKAVRTVSAG